MAATSDDLAKRLSAAWSDLNIPLWLPNLTVDLAAIAWRTLSRHPGLTPESYGTTRVLRQDANAMRHIATSINLDTSQAPDAIVVEILPRDIERQLAPALRFFGLDEIQKIGVSTRIQQSLAVLAEVPLLTPTLSTLVRVLHLVDTENDEIDVSFSDPQLPFSVFLSVPGPGVAAATLRIAEAILHEAMHLHLTLIEAAVPLVTSSEWTFFSPWRDEHRTAQGVLHALYVFRAISEAFLALSSEEQPFPWRHHMNLRRTMIKAQLEQVREFRQCPDLTLDGRALVNRLLV